MLVSTGQYVQEEMDLDTGGTAGFNLERVYRTDYPVMGSLGLGWAASVDERLLFGVDLYARQLEEEYKREYVDVLRSQIDSLTQRMLWTYDVSGVDTAEEELERRVSQLEQVLADATATADFLRALSYVCRYGGDSQRCQQLLERGEATVQRLTGQLELEKRIAAKVAEEAELVRQLEEEWREAVAVWEGHKWRADESDRLTQSNAAALLAGTPDEWRSGGLGSLTVVDGKGFPRPFVADGSGGWIPHLATEKEWRRIERTDGGWLATMGDGSKRTYREDGILMRLEDRNGNAVELERDSGGRLMGIISPRGSWSAVWSKGHIVAMESLRDAVERVAYSYSGKMLTGVTDADGDRVEMEYDSKGRLAALRKGDGSVVAFSHGLEAADGSAVTTATTNEEGHTETFRYDLGGRTTTYTSHSGEETTYHYDGSHRTTRRRDSDGTVTEWVYDSRGNAVKVTVNGDTTTHSHDAAGNLVSSTYSDGSRESWSYDRYGLPLGHTDRDGVAEEWERDGRGNATAYRRGGRAVWTAAYDSRGLVTSTTVYGGSEVTTSYQYDRWGNMTGRSTAGVREEWEYDGRNRVTAYRVDGQLRASYEYTEKTATERLAGGLERAYTWSGRKDLISIAETDTTSGERRVTEWEYDRRHLPVRQYVGDGTTRMLVAQWRHKPGGELEAELLQDGGQGWMTAYSYRGGLVHTIRRYKVGNPPADLATADLAALEAAAAEVHHEEYAKAIMSGNRTTVTRTDSLGREAATTYDSWLRPTATTNALGELGERSLSSAGRVLAETSAHGGQYQYGWDAAGRMATAAEQGGGQVRAAYNPDGSVATVTNRLGETTSYRYDSRGLVSAVISPGRREWYQHDSLGRITSVVLGETSDKTTAQRHTEYRYSQDGRSVEVMEGGLYTATYRLDAWGNVVETTDGEGNTTSRRYDSLGNLAVVTDGHGRETAYTHNALGLVAGVTHRDGTTTTYQYDHLGNVTRVTDSLGTVASYTYDGGGRLIRETGRPGVDRIYRYDELDRITEVRSGGQVVERYSYTDRGRTVTVTDGNGRDYTYRKDEFGRLVEEENRLGGTQVYTYDGEGQLQTKRDFNGGITTIEYTAGGTTKTIRYADGTTETLRYDMAGAIIEAMGATGTLRYSYDAAGRLASQTDSATGESLTYGYDRAGRRILMAGAGRETAYRYDIFGSPITGNYTTGSDYGYLGKPYDTTTGLYNYGYRDYSPQTVRFTTVDPIRDGANWFVYVNNDPVNYVDLWGLLASEPKRSKNIFSGFVDTVKGLFKDDGSEQIFTYGVSASGTVTAVSGAIGMGVYINPKNNILYEFSTRLMDNPVTMGLGMIMMATNISDAGGYAEVGSGVGIGVSGSIGITMGIYKSKEDASGAYQEIGGSISIPGGSIGYDYISNLQSEPIGNTISIGIGVGSSEFHGRIGVTGIKSFMSN